MKYYLSVLKEFFRLKWREIKLFFNNNSFTSILIPVVIILFGFYMFCGLNIDNYLFCKIIMYSLCGISILALILGIGILLFIVFKWLIKLIRDNWRQAKLNIKRR